jgi:hypothetical protein
VIDAVTESEKSTEAVNVLKQIIYMKESYDVCAKAVAACAKIAQWDTVAEFFVSVKDESLKLKYLSEVFPYLGEASDAEMHANADSDCEQTRMGDRTPDSLQPQEILRPEFSKLMQMDFNLKSTMNLLISQSVRGQFECVRHFSRIVLPHVLQSVLFRSISDGHVSLAISLLSHVTDINSTDSSGVTALMLAAEHGHDELIHEILRRNASVNAQDKSGFTALSRACCEGHVRSVKSLIDGGADAEHRDGENRSCEELASERGHTEVVKFLRSHKR